MKCFTLSPVPGTHAEMEVWLREKNYDYVDQGARPCVLIFPGGGYEFLSAREAEPIGMAFSRAGYQVCILQYSVRKAEQPFLGDLPLQEAAAAVRCIRSHAEEWGIDPRKITVCGSSAGGHLAGSLGVFGACKDRIPGSGDGMSRPDAMVLCYPVITAGEYSHNGSLYQLSGHPKPCPERDPWSLELHVTKDTCPAFIWHTTEDDCVPVDNSMLMAQALKKAGVPFELHLYTKGCHGLSLATAECGTVNAHAATWVPLALEWLREIGVGPAY